MQLLIIDLSIVATYKSVSVLGLSPALERPLTIKGKVRGLSVRPSVPPPPPPKDEAGECS